MMVRWLHVGALLWFIMDKVGYKPLLPPACAAVAVRYRDHWFYIDDRDRDSKATFALLLELSRLELGATRRPPPRC